MSSRLGIKGQRQLAQTNIKERYQQAYLRYTQGEFTYNSHCLIERLCQKAEEKKIQKRLFYLILIEVSKLMHLNELQLLFLGATLQQMKWQFSSLDLNQQAHLIPPIANIPMDTNHKKIEIQIFFISYTIKRYLNDENQVTIYDYKMKDILKAASDKLYQEWIPKAQSHFKFNPKSMNNLFKQFNDSHDQNTSEIIDYNERINQLLKDSDDRIKKQHHIESSNITANINNSYNNQQIMTRNNSGFSRAMISNIIQQGQQIVPHVLPRSFSERVETKNLIKKSSSNMSLIKDEEYYPQINFKKLNSSENQFDAG